MVGLMIAAITHNRYDHCYSVNIYHNILIIIYTIYFRMGRVSIVPQEAVLKLGTRCMSHNFEVTLTHRNSEIQVHCDRVFSVLILDTSRLNSLLTRTGSETSIDMRIWRRFQSRLRSLNYLWLYTTMYM